MTLQQDPLMNKVLNILSNVPFSKGGEIVDENLTPEEIDKIEKYYNNKNINKLLLGTSAGGMNATGEGDRKSWYDEVKTIQESVKKQLLVILGILAGLDDGKYKNIEDYRFNSLESLNEKEEVEVSKSKIEIAKSMIEMGFNTKDIAEWSKKDKKLNLGNIEIDDNVINQQELDDYETLLQDKETADDQKQE